MYFSLLAQAAQSVLYRGLGAGVRCSTPATPQSSQVTLARRSAVSTSFSARLNAPLQIGDACLSFWCLPVGIQALAPCVVPLPPSVPFNPVAVSSWCRRLGILGVMYMLARFPVVPQAAKLLLYLVEHIVGKQYVQLLVELHQQRIPAAIAGNPASPTVGNAQEYSPQCFGVLTGIPWYMDRIE